MRARHIQHALPSFPVYSSAFISPHELVLGGGGGSTRSGIKNKLALYRVGLDMKLDLLSELELEHGEDAPMSMAADMQTKTLVCGVNSNEEDMQNGLNENCRLYQMSEQRLDLVATQKTLTSCDSEDYQKATVLSPDGNFLAVAGGHDFSLLAYPSLSPVSHPIHVGKGEIYDATFSSTLLVIATTVNLLVYGIPIPTEKSMPLSNGKSKGKEKSKPLLTLELLRTVELPSKVGGSEGSTFRAARFHPLNDRFMYTVTNTVPPPRSQKRSSGPRQAFVCKWDTETWSVVKVRKIGNRGSTCFDISYDGNFLAYGSSDYTIGILDSNNLSILVSILKAHDFPPTTIRFNPTAKLLVSGSADNTLRIVAVPDFVEGESSGWLISVIVVLLVIILAIVVQQLLSSDLQIMFAEE